MQQEHERRQRIRVDFETRIKLTIADREYHAEGSSRDLSLNGVFVRVEAEAKPGQKCRLSIYLSGMVEETALEIEGSVVRLEEGGLAVAFESMGLASFTHLKNIVRYNTSEPDQVV